MKKHIKKLNRISFIKSWMIVSSLVIIGATSVGIYGMRGASAASATLYLTPASGSYTTGQTVTLSILENSGTEDVNTVQANLTYPTSLLSFTSIDGNNSAFGIDAGSTGGAGVVSIARGSTTSVTGAQLISTVTFTVLAAGNANIIFEPSCQGTNGAGCSAVIDTVSDTNIISGTTGSALTLATPATTTGTGTGTGTTGTTTTTTTTTAPANTTKSTSTSNASTATSVTPSNSVTPVTVPNDSTVQVNQPVTLQPATVQEEGVSEVQYYLNNKLVYTALSPPYSYNLNTKKLLNGTYSLITKTVYSSGESSTSGQILHVDNPLSATQIWLLFKKYIILPIIIIVLILVAYLIYRKYKSNHPFGNSTGFNSGGGNAPEAYTTQPTAPVIKPTVVLN
jgi:hypothetical protein